MSLKDLFQIKKVLPPVSNEQIAEEIESVELLDSHVIEKNRIQFAVNYSTGSNFAIFGSAKKYYQDTIKRVYEQYPYDGSKKEKLDWYNSSSLLDIWFYENAYPRTTGYGTFSPSGWSTQLSSISGYGNPTTKEYIVIKSGPNNKPSTTSLKDAFTDLSNQNQKANIYNVADNRTSNLKFDLSGSGVTLEFWLKKNSFIRSSTAKEVIFDLWNGAASSSAGYGRLTLELSGNTVSPFYLTAQSGTAGFFQQNIGTSVTTSSVASNLWNHYAVSLANSASSINVSFYVNGDLNSSYALGTTINDVTGGLVANLGALRTAPSGVSGVGLGWGKLSGSIDEFRYWKAERTDREIGRNWWTYVGGGTNTDDANTDLGVYYKFNEGITTTSSIDSIVLDYSGRVSNGTWVGYSTASRNTGSAVNEFTLKELSAEEPDPIIYSTHPDVVDTLEEYEVIGESHDRENPNSLYYSFPDWIVNEDAEGDLLNVSQIAASYLDTLYLQIKYFTTLKDHYTNIQIDDKPYPFSQVLLESTGLIAPNLFVDAKLVEEVLSRDDEREYEDKLNEVKNIIYQNIYSNITNIFKSKGTEKSFRNLIRCFGIDDDLVKLNIYSNNDSYQVRNNTYNTTVKKKSVNFNNVDRFNSSVYQFSDNTNVNSLSYVSGGSAYDYLPLTAEAEIVFPYKFNQTNENYFFTPFTTVSIFGAHGANSTASNLTWATPDYFNFQVSAVKTEIESKDVYFQISSSYLGVNLTSSIYFNTYNNQKWNFAVRIKPDAFDANLTSGSTSSNYKLEFYGVNTDGDSVKNEFLLTSSLSSTVAKNALRQNKRFYLGSERTNFTGSVVKQTDVKALGLRVWSNYLNNDVINTHAADPYNYGIDNASENSTLTVFNGVSIPKAKTLLLDWNFNLITGSNAGGGIPTVSDAYFIVQDLTSGSITDTTYNTQFNNLTNYQYTGKGDFFLPNKTDIVDTQYLFTSRLTQFEDIKNSNLIEVLNSEDQQSLTRQTRPITYFFSFEKSMYQTISEEMLKMFSSILDFNNLVGEPVNKYRKEYKSLGKLRQLFFDKVQNEPDLDKYLDFYKWIDSAIGKFLLQLTPASADTGEGLLNVIESHALERNKVQYKFPTAEFKIPVIEAGAVSINKHLYNWRVGFRPLSNSEDDNCLYWNERAERTVSPISSSNSNVNSTRTNIFNASLQVLNRSFTTPYRFNVEQTKQIKGGINFEVNKNIDFSSIALAPHGPLDTDAVINVPANYLVSLIQNTSSLIEDCNDVIDPNKKTKYYFNTVHGRDYLSSSLGYGEILSSKIALPINVISGTDNSGYQAQVSSEFMNGAIITNIHNDTYGYMNEVPVQGPFTNAWVGGRQSRHVNLNTGGDTYLNRAEAWKILLGTGSFSGSYQTALGMVGADYPFPEGNPDSPSYPVRAHLRATYLREETAKRPVNIRNIQTTTGSAVLGNYSNTYEVVHSVGSTTNNRELVDAVNPTTNTELSGIVRTNVTNGRVDFTLPTRQRSQTIIRNRFSAPGDYRTISRGYLTRYSEETSPYNSLPFKNRQVIGNGSRNADNLTTDSVQYPSIVSGSKRTLNQLLVIPSDFGGYSSGSTTIASLHKVNKNRVFVADNNFNYDNGFVTHAIPQKDAGYSWITASLSGTATDGNLAFYGSFNSEITLPTGSTSYEPTYLFVSASQIGSYFDTVGVTRRFPEDVGDISLGNRDQFIPIDFVGLNTLIYETSSYTTLGETTNDYQTLVNMDIVDAVDANKKPYIFSALMQHRNGPYGYPSFKQTRTGEHKVVRNLVRDNYTSLVLENVDGTETFVIKKEPNVYFNTPFTAKIRDTLTNQILTFKYSYENLLQTFEQPDLFNNLSISTNQTFYEKKIAFLLNNARYKLVNTKAGFSLYPRKRSKSLLESNKRINYVFSTWRDLRTDRNVTNTVSQFNYTVNNNTILIPKQSIWPMDSSASIGDGGVLQNSYSTIHNGVTSSITASVLYNYKHTLLTLDSYKSKSPIDAVLQFSQSSVNTYLDTSTGLFSGTAVWEAGLYGNNPYADSYDNWYEKIRSIAKDYSIVPEYIISDDTKLLAAQQNKFDDEYLNSISLTGSQFNVTASMTEDFINDLVRSDFIKDVDKIKNDLSSISKTVKLKLNCDAIIKFNAKPELYPQSRTIDLAEKFLTTTENYLSFWTGSGPIAANQYTQKNVAYRSILTPLFAPGILYNTIKSGIAVDYPILTASLQTTGSTYESGIPKETLINNSNFNIRLPFETLIQPETYLTTDIIDMEPNPSASLSITGSWSGQYSNNLYKMAINNFLAESINFFLPDGKLTTLYSKPESEFGLVDPSKTYQALVKIYKTANNNKIFDYDYGDSLGNTSRATRAKYVKPQLPSTSKETITMYSRPSAFGPACAGGEKGSTGYTKGIVDSSNGYNPAFTPPYYDGSSWAILTFKPSGSVPYKPTLNEIINNITSSYIRFEMISGTVGTSGPYSSANLNTNSMQVSASLNLFNIVNTNQVDLSTVDTVNIEPNSKLWAIQTKFETPILDFNPSNTGATVTSGSQIPTIGMWHQIGQIPEDDKGVYLQVTDVPRSYLVYGTNGVTLDLQASSSIFNTTPQLTGSLCDIVGFPKQEVKLGQVANEKTIKEAVVAIPYVEVLNQKIFINLPNNAVTYVQNTFFGMSKEIEQTETDILSSVPETVRNQLRAMKEYVIPPNFDFVNNDKVNPIAMYFFEFSYKLTQQDLVNIWQGMQPNISVEFEKQSSVIEHEVNQNEFINLTNLNERLQWLVFKVKQKAKTNYFDQVFQSIKEKNKEKINNLLKLGRNNKFNITSIESMPQYTYNWPYDFFSLVELAKIDAKLEFENLDTDPASITNVSNKTLKEISEQPKRKLNKVVESSTEDSIQLLTNVSSQTIRPASTAGDASRLKRNRR